MYLMASVGLNVSFPLWIGVVVPNGSDSYYVWFLVSGVNALFWGSCVCIGLLMGQLNWSTLTLPHWKTFLAGAWYAQNGLYVYAADPTRTPQKLMPMLCVNLPFTVLVRMVILGRYPVGKQRWGVAITLAGILVCLSPELLNLEQSEDAGGAPSGLKAIAWSLFMLFTTLGDSVTAVYSEEILDTPGVSIIYYLFWMELWHFILVVGAFWTDLIPGFGYATDMQDMAAKFWTGWEITFTGGGAATYLGVCFLSFWALQTLIRCVLIRFGDGATWSSLINALATPLQVLLLSVLHVPADVKDGGISIQFDVGVKTCVNLFGACLAVPGVLMYDRATRELQKARSLEEQLKTATSMHC